MRFVEYFAFGLLSPVVENLIISNWERPLKFRMLFVCWSSVVVIRYSAHSVVRLDNMWLSLGVRSTLPHLRLLFWGPIFCQKGTYPSIIIIFLTPRTLLLNLNLFLPNGKLVVGMDDKGTLFNWRTGSVFVLIGCSVAALPDLWGFN